MDLTAYRAIEANRWRSRVVAGPNAAAIAEARISRQREYLADAQAVLVTRHPEKACPSG